MLNIPYPYSASFKLLLERIPKHDPNPVVTFLIDKKNQTVIIIGGKTEALMVITLPLAEDSPLKTGKMSFDALVMKRALLPSLEYMRPSTDFEIDLVYGGKRRPNLKVVTKDRVWCDEKAQAPCEVHLEHLDFVNNLGFSLVPTSELKAIVETALNSQPFEAFEFKSQALKDPGFRILRDQKWLSCLAPCKIERSIYLLLNEESTNALHELCHHTQKKHLLLYIDNEQAIFSDSVTTLSQRLDSLSEYRHQPTCNYRPEAGFVAIIEAFKKEIAIETMAASIKENDTGYLLIDQDSVMVCDNPDDPKCASFLSTEDIHTKGYRLYRYKLSDMRAIKSKLKDITKAKQIKLQILIADDGHRVLGFFSDKDNSHPYLTIPVELDMGNLEKAQKIKEEYEAKLQSKPKQLDMFWHAMTN